jgi:hypothetical protein
MMTRHRVVRAALFTLLMGAVLMGCGESREPFVGKYQSVQTIPEKGPYVLDLRENGKGDWKLGDEPLLNFSWMVKNGRIYLYSDQGGVYIVTPAGDTLSADMTGSWHASCPPDKCITFKRLPAPK